MQCVSVKMCTRIHWCNMSLGTFLDLVANSCVQELVCKSSVLTIILEKCQGLVISYRYQHLGHMSKQRDRLCFEIEIESRTLLRNDAPLVWYQSQNPGTVLERFDSILYWLSPTPEPVISLPEADNIMLHICTAFVCHLHTPLQIPLSLITVYIQITENIQILHQTKKLSYCSHE